MAASANRRSTMTLYSNAIDPHCHQVRLVLAEKNIAVDTVDIKTNALPEDLIDLNPYQTLPTLADRDLALYHTHVILEYIEERFPHPPLMPVYPIARARCRLLMHRIEKDWYALYKQITSISPQAAKEDVEKARIAANELRNSLMSITQVFVDKPYFMSEEYTLVDCCLAPLLWRLPSLGITFPDKAKAIVDYAKRVFEREAFLKSLTESEKELAGSLG